MLSQSPEIDVQLPKECKPAAVGMSAGELLVLCIPPL